NGAASLRPVAGRWRQSEFLSLIQEVLDGGCRPLTTATRGSLTHGLELGANCPERHFRICHGDARDYHHQAILWRSARGPFQQFGVGEPLSDRSSNGSPQALGGPSRPVGLIEDPSGPWAIRPNFNQI